MVLSPIITIRCSNLTHLLNTGAVVLEWTKSLHPCFLESIFTDILDWDVLSCVVWLISALTFVGTSYSSVRSRSTGTANCSGSILWPYATNFTHSGKFRKTRDYQWKSVLVLYWSICCFPLHNEGTVIVEILWNELSAFRIPLTLNPPVCHNITSPEQSRLWQPHSAEPVWRRGAAGSPPAGGAHTKHVHVAVEGRCSAGLAGGRDGDAHVHPGLLWKRQEWKGTAVVLN